MLDGVWTIGNTGLTVQKIQVVVVAAAALLMFASTVLSTHQNRQSHAGVSEIKMSRV